MSYNLADLPMDERRAMEEHKDHSYGDAARIFGANGEEGEGLARLGRPELAGLESQ